MKKKDFKDAFVAKAKDCGLTDKAVQELAERGAASIGDDATDEQVQAQVDFFTDIAKSMQSEVTRKLQEQKNTLTKQAQTTPPDDKDGDDGAGKGSPQGEIAALIKQMQEQMRQMQEQSQRQAKEFAEAQRQRIVGAAAKKAGISDEMLKLFDTSKVTNEREADELFTQVRQTLINEGLPSKQSGFTVNVGSDKALEAAAEEFAKTLPDAK
ncbi:MAG: hypothetical protein LUI09_02125 [Prevotellaceae bacterium]|nr:hypothetical protein [Prevotellaceae bacterium]